MCERAAMSLSDLELPQTSPGTAAADTYITNIAKV